MEWKKLFGNILNSLKKPVNNKSTENPTFDYKIKTLEEKTQKLQDSLSSLQGSLGVVAKFSAAQLVRQSKDEEIHSGILKIVTQHEEELDNFKKLLNQHAEVINSIRKHVFQTILKEDSKKDLDETSENNSFLDIKKKINKDN